MDAEKRARLEAAGHRVFDDPADWLDLDEAERQLVDLIVTLGREIRRRRDQAGLAHKPIPEEIGTSRSLTGVVDTAASGVTLDPLFREFFALGGRIEDLGGVRREPQRSS